MANNIDLYSAIVENLRDAGCDDDLITKYVDLQAKGKTSEQLRMLGCHRCELMEKVHESQKRVDCLDYLIYSIKRGRHAQKQ